MPTRISLGLLLVLATGCNLSAGDDANTTDTTALASVANRCREESDANKAASRSYKIANNILVNCYQTEESCEDGCSRYNPFCIVACHIATNCTSAFNAEQAAYVIFRTATDALSTCADALAAPPPPPLRYGPSAPIED